MKYVQPIDQFLNPGDQPSPDKIQEDLQRWTDLIWSNFNNLSLTEYAPSSEQEKVAILEHQIYLLDNFDSIDQINENENLLIKNGYSPVFVMLEGGYFETCEALRALNENMVGDFLGDVWDAGVSAVSSVASGISSFFGAAYDAVKSAVGGFGKLGSLVWDFLKMMTEDFSLIGIVQFILDILGLIPGSWFGFPIDIVANLLNAAISFIRGNWLMGILNLVACADLSHIFAGLKTLIKPFAKIFEPVVKLIWKGESAAVKAETLAFKSGALKIDPAAKASKGLFEMLGGALKSIGTFIAQTGLKIVKGFADVIFWTIEKVTLGLVKKPEGITKWIDELSLKLAGAGKAATEAGELLLKDDAKVAAKSADTTTKAAAATRTASTAAGKTAAEVDAAVLKTQTLVSLDGLKTEVKADILASEGYAKLVEKGASNSIKQAYVKAAATERLVGNVLMKESPSSVINILKNPEIAAEMSKFGAKPAEKMLADAIKVGDTVTIEKMFGEMLENPKILEELAKHEPQVAKTINLFKSSPEALVKGTKRLGEIQKMLGKFTGKMAYRGVSGRAFICFVIKCFLKGSKCAHFLTDADPTVSLNNAAINASGKDVGIKINEMNSLISKIVIENTDLKAIGAEAANAVAPSQQPAQPDQAGAAIAKSEETASQVSSTGDEVSAEDLEKFKQQNPEGYDELMKVSKDSQEKTKDAAKKLTPKNPCYGDTSSAIAKTGCFIKQPHAYKEGQVVTNLITQKDWDESGIMEHEKSILKQLGEDANIDPQHPLSKQSAYVQAYFADVYDSQPDGTKAFSPNYDGPSRLDQTLADLVKDGILNESQLSQVKEETLKHWENGTQPDELLQIDETPSTAPQKTNESLFKIGKLITIR